MAILKKNCSSAKKFAKLIDVLKDPAKPSNLFSVVTDGSNCKKSKTFLPVVRYFDLRSSVTNRFFNFPEQTDETDNALHNFIKFPLNTRKLHIKIELHVLQ
jgi:hypothetical protein